MTIPPAMVLGGIARLKQPVFRVGSISSLEVSL